MKNAGPGGRLPQLVPPRQIINESARLDLKSVRDFEQVVQADASLAALHLTQEGPVDAAAVSQRLLGQAPLLAKDSDSAPELDGGGGLGFARGRRHGNAKPIRLMRKYPECNRLMRNRPIWCGTPEMTPPERRRTR